MPDLSGAEKVTAIKTLAPEILNEINAPVPIDMSARITARLEEAVNEWLRRTENYSLMSILEQ
jgi:hypothetical protein